MMSNSEARKRAQEQVASPRGDEAGDVEALARVIDPEAFEDHPIENRRPAAALQWSARRHIAREHAGRVLASDWLAARDAEQRRLGAEAETGRVVAAIRSYAEGFAFPQQGDLWRQVAEYVETHAEIARAAAQQVGGAMSEREGRPQGGMKSEMGRAAYWRMNYESAIQALADLIAENTENVEFARDFYAHNADLLSDHWRAEFVRVFPPTEDRA